MKKIPLMRKPGINPTAPVSLFELHISSSLTYLHNHNIYKQRKQQCNVIVQPTALAERKSLFLLLFKN